MLTSILRALNKELKEESLLLLYEEMCSNVIFKKKNLFNSLNSALRHLSRPLGK